MAAAIVTNVAVLEKTFVPVWAVPVQAVPEWGIDRCIRRMDMSIRIVEPVEEADCMNAVMEPDF